MATNSVPGSAAPQDWQTLPSAEGQRGHWQCACGQTLRFDFQASGKKGRCPACGRAFTIPQREPLDGALATLRGHNGAVRSIAFSPDGRLVATAAEVSPATVAKSELAETQVWEVASGLPAVRLHWHRHSVTALAFSPNGHSLVTASKDHTISIWNVERGLWDAVMGAHEHGLRGHQAAVTAVAFSPNGGWLASAASDQTVRIWDTNEWRLTKTIDTQRTGEGRLAFSPCGRYLATVWASRGPTTLWNVITGERHMELRLFSDEDSADYGVGFLPDGARLVVLGSRQVRLWDLSTCQVLATFEVSGSEALAVSPREGILATAGRDSETDAAVTLWDAGTFVRVREFGGHEQAASAVAFSPDGKLLASGGRDGLANVWQLA